MTNLYSEQVCNFTERDLISWGCFEIAASKFLDICQKNVCGGVPFRAARIKSTAYYRTALQIHSGSVQKEKDILRFQNSKLSLFFSNATALQS